MEAATNQRAACHHYGNYGNVGQGNGVVMRLRQTGEEKLEGEERGERGARQGKVLGQGQTPMN